MKKMTMNGLDAKDRTHLACTNSTQTINDCCWLYWFPTRRTLVFGMTVTTRHLDVTSGWGWRWIHPVVTSLLVGLEMCTSGSWCHHRLGWRWILPARDVTSGYGWRCVLPDRDVTSGWCWRGVPLGMMGTSQCLCSPALCMKETSRFYPFSGSSP